VFDTQGRGARVDLSRDELTLLNNTLNDVCNGVRDLDEDNEFATRLGASREDARRLLGEIGGSSTRWDSAYLPISRLVVLCSPAGRQEAPGSGIICSMAGLVRQQLVALLEADTAIDAPAALDALRSGADFTYYDETAHPAEHFAKIYRRRAEHIRRTGLDVRGLDQAVERLEAASEFGALAVVHDEGRDCSVFLTPGAATVVACVSVPAG
jgi:hypothetical protein